MFMAKALTTLAIAFFMMPSSAKGGQCQAIFTDDTEVELSARKFSVISDDPSTSTQYDPKTGKGGDYDNNPIISIGKTGPYDHPQTTGSFTVGLFNFSETVMDERISTPSRLRIYNGSRPVAEFLQGLHMLGAGSIPGPGPGGVSAMDFSIHATTNSTSVSTGAIVTAGGLGIAKSVHIGGSLAIGRYGYKTGGGSWTDMSDRRLKTNVKPIAGALYRIARLTPVRYDWRNPNLHGAKSEAGFIAQEVEKVFPELVSDAKCVGNDCALTGGKNIRTLALPFAFKGQITAAVKELSATTVALAKRLSDLSVQVVTLRLYAKEAQATVLCLQDTCVDEQKLKRLLRKQQFHFAKRESK